MADDPIPERAPDFFSAYANNVRYELQSLDLRMVFAQTRQNQPPELQGSVAVSWPEAKIMAYFLFLNIAIYEAISGKIDVPRDMIPQPPLPLTVEEEADPIKKAIQTATIQLHQQVFGDGQARKQ